MIAALLAACVVLMGNIIEWDLPTTTCGGAPGIPAAVHHFQIERMTASVGTWQVVGLVPGEFASWNTAGDSLIPHADVAYKYRVWAFSYDALGNLETCGPSLAVDSCGPPMCCFEGDPAQEVQCYVGANLRCR